MPLTMDINELNKISMSTLIPDLAHYVCKYVFLYCFILQQLYILLQLYDVSTTKLQKHSSFVSQFYTDAKYIFLTVSLANITGYMFML